MTEATFHVVLDLRRSRPGKESWWAEIIDMDDHPSAESRLGYGSTPGEAVDDLVRKMKEVPS